MHFPEPVMSVAIEPRSKADDDNLHKALSKLSEDRRLPADRGLQTLYAPEPLDGREVGILYLRARKRRVIEPRAAEIRADELGACQIGVAQVRRAQVRKTEIGA